MNVVFTCDTLDNGGAERVISLLSNSFAEKKISVTIVPISTSNTNSFYKLSPDVKIEVLFEGKKPLFLNRLILLRKKIKRFNPDVIISFLPHVCFYTYLSTRLLNIPIILSERNDPSKYSAFVRMLSRFIFTYSDACVYQTVSAIRWYKNNELPRHIIINNPVNIEKNNISILDKNLIISVGRFEKQKNYDLLITSFCNLSKENPNLKLVLIGDGSLRNRIVDLIKENNLQDRVELVGKDDEWHKNYSNAGLFVLSSLYEGMPNSLLEALCLGIECVSTDCPAGSPAYFKSIFSNITLCKNNDSQDMTIKINNSLEKIKTKDDNELYIPKEFCIEEVTNRWLCLIDEVINYG